MALRITSLKTDTSREATGAWVDYLDGAKLLIARNTNPKYTAFLAKEYEKNRASLSKGARSGGNDIADAIMVNALSQFILLDWKGFEDDAGRSVPYSVETAKEYLKVRDFRQDVERLSDTFELFRKEEVAEAVGN